MSSFSSKMNLDLISSGVGDNLSVHNRGILKLDSLVMGSAKTRQLSTPPGGLVAGDTFIVLSPGAGSWVSKDEQIAYWTGAAWVFTPAKVGMRMWLEDESIVVSCLAGPIWKAVTAAALFGGQKTSSQTVSTTINTWLDVLWDSEMLDISDSSIFEHPSANKERIICHEAGSYELCANVDLDSTGGTANWVRMTAQVLVGTVGSPSVVTGKSAHCSVHQTLQPKKTMPLHSILTVADGDEIRVQVSRQDSVATAPTITVTVDSRALVRKL